MRVQKGLATLATISLLGLSVACESSKDRFAEGLAAGQAEGYAEGYDQGYGDGYVDGDMAGFERAKSYFASADYLKGFSEGKTEGISIGYSQGYNVGKQDGVTQGYNNGYNAGYSAGDANGYADGFNDGYDEGYYDGERSSTAYNTGYYAGYDHGYEDGAYDGYDLGYDDGFDAGYDYAYSGYGLSIGKTKKLQGYADVISAFHNELIDYSKITLPVVTKRGLVANGQLLLSETSTTNKDTLKRAAVVEQYLVVEMAKQVKGKFGLSAERSLKVAKAANHFRKYSSNRALTAEDTNAYATEIIGVDFASISKAYESGLKGDLGAFNSVMEKAAEKNETSPEKMTQIITQLFI